LEKNIKRDNNIHKKTYLKYHGKIPRDEEGRSYDIHHIDGDHQNNDPKNLTAIPIQEHYRIHYEQGDYGACLLMTQRMRLTPEEISDLSRKTQLKRVEERTHPFLGGTIQKENAEKRIKNGTHPWSAGNKKMMTCPVCGKTMPVNNYVQNKHGKNCKQGKV
jgi:hypothetical protein